MAFDWIAGTALIVGMGSLYLTYQSTKSAKRAIDTSIELYEKQKQDDGEKIKAINEKKLIAKIKIIENEIVRCYLEYMMFFNVCSAIKTRDSFSVTIGNYSNFTGVAIDAEKTDSVSGLIQPSKLDFTNDFINELYLLDEKLAGDIVSLKGCMNRSSHIMNHMVLCKDNLGGHVELKRYVERFYTDIELFKYTMEKVHDSYSITGVSLMNKYQLAHM
ncbi:hypothetical protein ACS638_000450 [Proteus mirabilis]|uniref:hypothetical protein n=1 Tax=Proteus mirabilis TaxID=584 RepID=UPI002B281BF6|nr:hypothetical protein R2B79_08190 [Proteus mirabilis]